MRWVFYVLWGIEASSMVSNRYIVPTPLPKLPVSATLAYTRSSSANKKFAGIDHRPPMDESYEDMMYKLHRYAEISTQIRYLKQIQTTSMHHPESVSMQVPAGGYIHLPQSVSMHGGGVQPKIVNLFAGGLMNE